LKIVLAIAVSCALAVGALIFSLSYMSQSPSTADLDADIAEVSRQIEEAEGELAAYAGGAIQTLISMRIEVLKTTSAMLEQKRTSLLRRIDLDYTVDGHAHAPSAETIAALESDLADTTREKERFQTEADRYTGGLIQTIALMNVATNEMTISQLKLSLLAERYGFVFSVPQSGQPSEPVGQNIVQDETEAL
jgi:hypothetical protein